MRAEHQKNTKIHVYFIEHNFYMREYYDDFNAIYLYNGNYYRYFSYWVLPYVTKLGLPDSQALEKNIEVF